MSDDIFHSWKEHRFVIAPEVLVDREQLVILTDISYWLAQFDELKIWCDNNNCAMEGMTVVFPDEKTLAMFVLKWS